ncbi:uncharacterized protein WM277_016206 isoform 1-T1 [Molossus nigricans]
MDVTLCAVAPVALFGQQFNNVPAISPPPPGRRSYLTAFSQGPDSASQATDFIDLKNLIWTVTVLPKEKPNGIRQTRGDLSSASESTEHWQNMNESESTFHHLLFLPL